MKKIVIAGSRNFNDYERVKKFIDNYIQDKAGNSITILSGGCRGADLLGEKYAKENGYEVVRISPEWEKYGRAAGIVRNKKMAEMADVVVCFWDGKSKGTKAMINHAKKLNKETVVKIIDLEEI